MNSGLGANAGIVAEPTPKSGERLIYVDFDGVLHHEAVYWSATRGVHLNAPKKYSLFQHVGLLEEMLGPYPDVSIVLSTSWVVQYGFERAAKNLPLSLRNRVIGATFQREMNVAEFLGTSRGMQVWGDVLRRQPRAWLAIDDDYLKWPAWCRGNLIRSHPKDGIAAVKVQEIARKRLQQVFGQ